LSYLYLDTSAIVKRYAAEKGSAWLQNLVNPSAGNTVLLSEITIAEFAAAISAKSRANTLSLADRTNIINLFLLHCNIEYQLTAANRNVVDDAVNLVQNHPLRGYDAVQLSTALNAKTLLANAGITDFIFITADKTLITAATAEGLAVDNPDNHP
jgi:predicted nucleic acid-binding protein